MNKTCHFNHHTVYQIYELHLLNRKTEIKWTSQFYYDAKKKSQNIKMKVLVKFHIWVLLQLVTF